MRFFAVAALLAGCSGSPAPLDCAWLSGMNCWKTTLQAATACLPPRSAVGSFGSDRKICAYGGGPQVWFIDPVPAAPATSQRWNFTMLAGNAGCVKLEQPDDQTSRVTTAAGIVTIALSGTEEVVTCPDGKKFGGNAFSLLQSCGLAELPGTEVSGSGGVTFSFLGGPSGDLHVFSCQ